MKFPFGIAILVSIFTLATGCSGGGPRTTGDDLGEVEPLSLDDESGTDGSEQPGISEMNSEQLAAQFEQDLADFRAVRDRPSQTDPPFPTIPYRRSGSPPQIKFVEHARIEREPTPQGTGDALPTAEVSIDDDPVIESPLDTPPEMRMREAMVNLRRELYQDASYSSEPLRQYLAMAAMTLIDPERTINPDALPDLRERERDILRAHQNFFIELGRELHASGDEAKLVDLIDQLRSALIEEPQLNITQSQLCTRVDGFGSFDAFDKNVFLAGSEQDVVIYTELESFTSTLNADNMWITDLWQELVIYNSHDNVPVWHQEWQPATDTSARKRTDFFISHLVTLPDRLTVGGYTLKIRIRDDATGVVTEAGIQFQIVADRTLTARAAQ